MSVYGGSLHCIKSDFTFCFPDLALSNLATPPLRPREVLMDAFGWFVQWTFQGQLSATGKQILTRYGKLPSKIWISKSPSWGVSPSSITGDCRPCIFISSIGYAESGLIS